MEPPTVFVVDDDNAMRNSLAWLLESVGLRVKTFASATEFLESYTAEQPGCLVVDVRMPGMSGLELQDRLRAHHARLPLIVITGHGDIPMAVRAMKAGAVDFFEKPFNDQVVIERIQQCLEEDRKWREERAGCIAFARRVASLTKREMEVFERVLAGKSNKLIAHELDISCKTVEVHRARMMDKMGADSLAQLVATSVACGLDQPGNGENPDLNAGETR